MSGAPAAALSRRALEFLCAPARYADASWWPAPYVTLYGTPHSAGAQTCARVSALLLRQIGQPSVAPDFNLPAARLWLLPAAWLRTLAVAIGLGVQHKTLRRCVTRTERTLMQSRFDAAALAFALSDRAAPLAVAMPTRIRDVAALTLPQCAYIGARLLLGLAGDSVSGRARLMFPRTWPIKRAPAASMTDTAAAAALAVAIEHSMEGQPSWRWLFS